MIEVLNAVHNIVSVSPEELAEKNRARKGVYYLDNRDMIVIVGWEHAKKAGELIACYLELTPDERQTVDQMLLSSGKDGVIALAKMFKEIARIRREKGQIFMRTDEIRIFPCFADHPPDAEKLQRKEVYYQEHNSFESPILIDGAGNLIDGYTSYLLAVRHGIEHVPVQYGRRQIVTAAHKPEGKRYRWELPGLLVGRIQPGDKVTVQTARGFRRVKVETVEEYAGEAQPLKMVVRKGRMGRR